MSHRKSFTSDISYRLHRTVDVDYKLKTVFVLCSAYVLTVCIGQVKFLLLQCLYLSVLCPMLLYITYYENIEYRV